MDGFMVICNDPLSGSSGVCEDLEARGIRAKAYGNSLEPVFFCRLEGLVWFGVFDIMALEARVKLDC